MAPKARAAKAATPARRGKDGSRTAASAKSRAAKRPLGTSSSKRSTKTSPSKRPIRPGFISHTDLASADPMATKTWCEEVLGWKFEPSMPAPTGEYHLWNFGNQTSGGIRAHNPPELAGSIPYCEVTDVQAAYAKALAAGARQMMPPTPVPGSGGSIAIVLAPGGVSIGFWGES